MNTWENTSLNDINDVKYPTLTDPAPSAPQSQDPSLHITYNNSDNNALIPITTQLVQRSVRNFYVHKIHRNNEYTVSEPLNDEYTVSEPLNSGRVTSTHVNLTVTDINLCTIL